MEIDSIIIAKAKEVDESKKVMTSLQNDVEEPQQACCLKRNF